MTPNLFIMLEELKGTLRFLMGFSQPQPTLELANGRLSLIEMQCREMLKEVAEAEANLAA